MVNTSSRNVEKDCTKVKCKCLYRDCLNTPEWVCPRCARVYELIDNEYVLKTDLQ
ncbi:MAG: hypothetical protein LBU74_01145 [Methanobacteriaceae archaeon]|nr:hypothetical protein [Candidatus Methanorudis spinitermitis]